MDARFLAHYQRELQHLRDMAGEFAAEFPKIAGRLSLDGFECADPYVERLLEGFAFMAARVQLKFDAGYTRFTQHLLDTVLPGALAPLPSILIAQFEPDLRDPALAAGAVVPRGSALRSRCAPDEQTACEYRTGHAATLWPLAVREAGYLPRAGDLAALGIAPPPGAAAGLRIVFDVTAGLRADQLALDRLSVFLRGAEPVPARLHEHLLGHALGFVLRPVGSGAHPPVKRDAAQIRAVGFADDEALLPPQPRGFSGDRLLQEYFAFPARFRFVEFGDLNRALRRFDTTAFELVVLFDRTDAALERAVDASAIGLHCVPAINLFPKRADRVRLDERHTDHHLVADRTRPMDFEVHSVTGVVGHGAGERRVFRPFYGVGARGEAGGITSEGAWYGVQRTPRRSSGRQQRHGLRSSYLGSEMSLSLVDARERPFHGALRELAVDTLCTNRDLPLLMPLGGSDDFTLDSAAPLAGIRCIQGPTRPRPPQDEGEAHWRLINQLSLNHLSLLDGDGHGEGGNDHGGGTDAGEGAAALRDLLSLHADPQDASSLRQVGGVRSVSQRPIHRRLPSPGPICFGRGLEITLTCDERAFEGGSAFLLGSVLEQFFARHVSLNGFTETVLRSATRGEVKRWPARLGRRPAC